MVRAHLEQLAGDHPNPQARKIYQALDRHLLLQGTFLQRRTAQAVSLESNRDSSQSGFICSE